MKESTVRLLIQTLSTVVGIAYVVMLLSVSARLLAFLISPSEHAQTLKNTANDIIILAIFSTILVSKSFTRWKQPLYRYLRKLK